MIHLLVTANSHGNPDYFPRLYTALRQIRGRIEGKVWLVDMGMAWSAESWMCRATENRAPYVVMDAMGYDAIFADGLTPANRERLQGQMLTRLLFPDSTFDLGETGLKLMRDISIEELVLDGSILRLPLLPTKTICHLQIDGLQLVESSVIEVKSDTLPDATIAAAVEFVISEARYYQKKQGSAE